MFENTGKLVSENFDILCAVLKDKFRYYPQKGYMKIIGSINKVYESLDNFYDLQVQVRDLVPYDKAFVPVSAFVRLYQEQASRINQLIGDNSVTAEEAIALVEAALNLIAEDSVNMVNTVISYLPRYLQALATADQIMDKFYTGWQGILPDLPGNAAEREHIKSYKDFLAARQNIAQNDDIPDHFVVSVPAIPIDFATPLFDAWYPIIDTLPYSIISFGNLKTTLSVFQNEISLAIEDMKKAEDQKKYILQEMFTEASLKIWSGIADQVKQLVI